MFHCTRRHSPPLSRGYAIWLGKDHREAAHFQSELVLCESFRGQDNLNALTCTAAQTEERGGRASQSLKPWVKKEKNIDGTVCSDYSWLFPGKNWQKISSGVYSTSSQLWLVLVLEDSITRPVAFCSGRGFKSPSSQVLLSEMSP